jgi:hypothetical protein
VFADLHRILYITMDTPMMDKMHGMIGSRATAFSCVSERGEVPRVIALVVSSLSVILLHAKDNMACLGLYSISTVVCWLSKAFCSQKERAPSQGGVCATSSKLDLMRL